MQHLGEGREGERCSTSAAAARAAWSSWKSATARPREGSGDGGVELVEDGGVAPGRRRERREGERCSTGAWSRDGGTGDGCAGTTARATEARGRRRRREQSRSARDGDLILRNC